MRYPVFWDLRRDNNVVRLNHQFDDVDEVHVFTDVELHDLAERIANLPRFLQAHIINEPLVYDILASEREPDSADGGSGERTP